MSRRRQLETGLVVLAVLAALLPNPPALVERWFATGIYPGLQRVITPLGNLLPFAIFDLALVTLLLGVTALAIVTWQRVRRERSIRPVWRSLWQLVVAGAGGYLLFLGLWGLNYRRVPMTERLELRASVPDREAVNALGRQAVERLNALHDQAHALGWSGAEWRDPTLIGAFTEVQRWLEDTGAIVPGRLKRTLLAPYFRWTGVDGMINPFGLEVLVNSDLLPWERPFVAAHEWAHLAGFADESEANFVAWLACLRAGPPAEYSAWLYVYWEVSGELSPADREALSAALLDGPRRDLAAIVERLRRGQLPALRNASWVVYDQYLRANRVEEGIRSYGEVVTLILRTRFADRYRPIRRASEASSR